MKSISNYLYMLIGIFTFFIKDDSTQKILSDKDLPIKLTDFNDNIKGDNEIYMEMELFTSKYKYFNKENIDKILKACIDLK